MTRYPRFVILFVIFIVSMMLGFPLPFAQSQTDIIELIPNTAILLDQSSGSGSGGEAAPTSSAENFSAPAVFRYQTFRGRAHEGVDPRPFTAAAEVGPDPRPRFQ